MQNCAPRGSKLPAEEKLVEEQKIGVLRTQMVRLLDGFLEMCTHEETLGLDPTDHLSYLDEVLSEVAEREAGRLDIARARVTELDDQLARVATEEEAAIRAELSAFQERLHGTSTSLGAIVELMDRRGLGTADHKQLLIRATGTVTTLDILDSRVLFGLLREGWTNFTDWLAARGPQFLFKAFFFLVTLGFVSGSFPVSCLGSFGERCDARMSRLPDCCETCWSRSFPKSS